MYQTISKYSVLYADKIYIGNRFVDLLQMIVALYGWYILYTIGSSLFWLNFMIHILLV